MEGRKLGANGERDGVPVRRPMGGGCGVICRKSLEGLWEEEAMKVGSEGLGGRNDWGRTRGGGS